MANQIKATTLLLGSCHHGEYVWRLAACDRFCRFFNDRFHRIALSSCRFKERVILRIFWSTIFSQVTLEFFPQIFLSTLEVLSNFQRNIFFPKLLFSSTLKIVSLEFAIGRIKNTEKNKLHSVIYYFDQNLYIFLLVVAGRLDGRRHVEISEILVQIVDRSNAFQRWLSIETDVRGERRHERYDSLTTVTRGLVSESENSLGDH